MEITEREWKLMQENERLKAKVKKQNIEIADLKSQKKTLKSKLQIANEYAEDLKKNNKIKENEKLKLKISILSAEKEKLKSELATQIMTINNLTTRLNKDSSNSSKPSSSDNIYKKKIHINSNREKGGKNGGQFGHKGNTFNEKDIKELLKNENVKHEIIDVGNIENPNYKSKYVCDIETTLVIKEYRYHENKKKKYDIPINMLPIVQYGPYTKALMVYVTDELMSPLNKTVSFMQSLTKGKYKISEGTIVNTQRAIDKILMPIVEDIKEKLIGAKILHSDETGVRVNGELKWLHAYCSDKLFYYAGHEKRGSEAMKDIGILEFFTGILVHDHWKSYYKETSHMTHAECNAHILRYLKSVLEITKYKDVENLIKLLVKMNEEKNKAIENNESYFTEETIKLYEAEYMKYLTSWGMDLNKRISKSKNPKVFDDERTLHDRLVEFKEPHLLFIKNFEVPFDNNFGERAIRMVKGKINSCGGFRTMEGLDRFARARSFMMTSKYRKENILDNLVNLFSGEKYNLS